MPSATDPTLLPSSPDLTLMEKVMSQPDWLLGLAVGGVISAVMLVIVLPRQQYAQPVKTPSDLILVEAHAPLAPDVAAKLTLGRKQLTQGKIDAAMLNLNAVIEARPENLEARWLLASTLDNLGDRARAAKHYQAYLEVHGKLRAIEDERAVRAREVVGLLTGEP